MHMDFVECASLIFEWYRSLKCSRCIIDELEAGIGVTRAHRSFPSERLLSSGNYVSSDGLTSNEAIRFLRRLLSTARIVIVIS